MYLELDHIDSLPAGYYYYHPVSHQLILIKEKTSSKNIEIKLHFIGKKSAIQPIYKNNIQEVLEMEVGHMIGLFEKILPDYGLSINACKYNATNKNFFEVVKEDYYLGAFQLNSGKKQTMKNSLDIYVQMHSRKITDLKSGLYQYIKGDLIKVSDQIILKKHVIAINQAVYDRAAFGITVISRTHKKWMQYINLGRALQLFQMNGINIGLMSSGYSSKSGNNLPSARRMQEILGKNLGTSYFFIGGRISDEQRLSHGMKEDTVHMKGPAEMIKDDLINFLPDYMIPNKIIILDKMPLTVNGKIDLKEVNKIDVKLVRREYIAPRTEIEEKICQLWQQLLKREDVSVNDNFFEMGGNSLIAVNLINKINRTLNANLSLQVLFESPSIEKLASKIKNVSADKSSRLVKLQGKGKENPIYCWPGLGGYCMNLRLLGEKIGTKQPFYGVQAYGINENEIPYLTLQQMAAEDIKLIKAIQPKGPYRSWGYSFGSRVAFEAAYQLEQAGEEIENLVLLAPGSPKVKGRKTVSSNVDYSNKVYLTILFSVFMSNITDPALKECLQIVDSEEKFIDFITRKNSRFDSDWAKRIIQIVSRTYGLRYSADELIIRHLKAPIIILTANGDESFFVEDQHFTGSNTFKIVKLKASHYNVLKEPDINELMNALKLHQVA